MDYFQIDGDRMLFFTAVQAEKQKQKEGAEKAAVKPKASSESSQSNEQSSISASGPSAATTSSQVHHSQAALPVRQEEVSFNLSISVEEQLAKSRVQLPYMHQGQPRSSLSSSSVHSVSTNAAANGTNSKNLFFIDDDDPDWDDDDLDDDLDI